MLSGSSSLFLNISIVGNRKIKKIKLKIIIKNMQKLLEAPDKKRRMQAQRKGTVPRKERISFSFSYDQQSDNT